MNHSKGFLTQVSSVSHFVTVVIKKEAKLQEALYPHFYFQYCVGQKLLSYATTHRHIKAK